MNNNLDVSGDLQGTFLSKKDFSDEPQSFVISRVERVHFEARNGRSAQSRWCVIFDDERRLSLNKTNLTILARHFGANAALWRGRTISVERDDSISFGGQLVGGLRVRVPKTAPASVTPPAAEFDSAADELGF